MLLVENLQNTVKLTEAYTITHSPNIQTYFLLTVCYILCPYIGEGNGNSLQYSCLENPMDGGAW